MELIKYLLMFFGIIDVFCFLVFITLLLVDKFYERRNK